MRFHFSFSLEDGTHISLEITRTPHRRATTDTA
jgi:hypothetical protein